MTPAEALQLTLDEASEWTVLRSLNRTPNTPEALKASFQTFRQIRRDADEPEPPMTHLIAALDGRTHPDIERRALSLCQRSKINPFDIMYASRIAFETASQLGLTLRSAWVVFQLWQEIEGAPDAKKVDLDK